MLRRWRKRTFNFAMRVLRLLGRLLLCVAALIKQIIKEAIDFWFGEEKPIIYKAGEGYPEVEILPRGGVYVSMEAIRRSPKAMANIRALQRAISRCIREQEETGNPLALSGTNISYWYAREQMKEPAWQDSAAQTSDARQPQDSGEGGKNVDV